VAAKDLRKDIMLAKNSEQGKQNPRTEMGYDACQE
jgi:hypothetical protein